jgi:putative acetyltransferase
LSLIDLEAEGLDWEIRAYEASDDMQVRKLLEAAFETDLESRLVDALRAEGSAVIELVAEWEGTIIGYVMLSRMTTPRGALGLGPVATAANARRQGVASSLIESGLALDTADDWHTVFVLGDLDYYERFGFERAERFTSPYQGPHWGVTFLDEDVAPKKGAADYASAFEMFE